MTTSKTTRVVEFNDLEALEHALAHGDVAAILVETPFHNMALMCPDTTATDVDAHSAMFLECVQELFS